MINGGALDELTSSFLTEAREMLDEVEPYLVELGQVSSEEGAIDPETVNLVFRLFHSLKGSAGFFQFSTIVGVTHVAETLLELFRSGKAQMGARHTDVLCRACDVVGLLLDRIETVGSDTGIQDAVEDISRELLQVIEEIRTGGAAPTRAEVAPSDRPAASPPPPPEPAAPNLAAAEPAAAEPPAYDPKDFFPMGDFLERFIQEADEQLERVEQVLLALEKSPDNREEVDDAFRSLHSFKGNCGFCGLAELEHLSHSAETVMDALRRGEAKLERAVGPLLHVVDVLRGGVADLSQGGDGRLDHLSVLLDMLGDIAPSREPEEGRPVVRAEVTQSEALDLLRDNDPPAEKEAVEVEAAVDESQSGAAGAKQRSVIRNDIRVDLRKLDQLINLVGEMVIAEAMVTKNPDLAGREFENFERAALHMNKIVRDLQDVALSVRMIPISGIFRKMIRLVHDLSAKADKKVELKLLGEETEIDKTVAEQLADPLVHLVRNAIDHGIETPQARRESGKNDVGELLIEAKHEGGEVWITIKDDGRGLSREKILKKAHDRELIKGDGSDMSDPEVFSLIFEPGFSTAEKVTDISGRGVGMDVVKKNIEKIKGRVDVYSQPGRGATFILRIPLTLAIMEGMLVRVGKARYTIPILSIRESLRIQPQMVTTTMDGQEVAKVRDELLPVLRLHELHGVEPDHLELAHGLLIILEGHGEAFCLFIDEILGEHHTVIKGLSGYLGDVRGVSGCTILGDGEISLILDVGGLMALAAAQSAKQSQRYV
ncbi:MAG: chemotaxis protein CheA [Pseudomonadota bacterium]